MNEIQFILPLKINSKLSLNSIYSGLRWSIRRKQAQKIHNMIRLALLSYNIPQKPFEKSIDINFKWYSKLDLDNHGYIAKLIIDSLKGYLIHDDTKQYINSITHEYGEEKGVKIKLQEAEIKS